MVLDPLFGWGEKPEMNLGKFLDVTIRHKWRESCVTVILCKVLVHKRVRQLEELAHLVPPPIKGDVRIEKFKWA